MPNGVIVNAPQIANASGQADKVISIDLTHNTVVYRETNGFQGGDPVKYASFDSSDPVAATLEDVTYAPALESLPTLNDDSTASARATLIAFVNGQIGADNPQRQGLNSAILDGLDPLNLLRWNPSQGRYSPMWDVNLAAWSQQDIADHQNLRQMDVGTAQGLASQGHLTAARRGTAYGPPASSSIVRSSALFDRLWHLVPAPAARRTVLEPESWQRPTIVSAILAGRNPERLEPWGLNQP